MLRNKPDKDIQCKYIYCNDNRCQPLEIAFMKYVIIYTL